MLNKLLPLLIGFCLDLLIGDPHEIPHPVVLIGKLISWEERRLRDIFPKTAAGERTAGLILWIFTAAISTVLPWLILQVCGRISLILRIAVESIMVWQILAVRSLKDESMKVYRELVRGDLQKAREKLSMIVGRDTEILDEPGIIQAAVETIAENTSDGVIAPLFFMALGGAPAGFFYKAVNTMDSMLGYIDAPYTNFGLVPARADDVCNFIPSRLAAILMLAAGAFCGLDVPNGWKIFRRDRYKHASPNSAQTEAVCAGLLRVRLAGNARYHGILHEKPYIGDDLREIRTADIPLCCRLLYVTSFLMFGITCIIRILVLR